MNLAIALVTGASGFLGGRLAQILAARGECVRVLARKTSDLSHLDGLPVEVVYGDLAEADSLPAAVSRAQIVYHCAALSTDWAPWSAFHQANVVGVQNLLKAVRQSDTLERFLHVSTTDVYGYPVVPGDESHPIVDTGLPYNRSKGMGENAVWEAHRWHGLPTTIVRPVTIFGPRSKDIVLEIAELIRQGMMVTIDGGRTPAGLLYVDNAVEGMIQAATSAQTVGEVYNLRDESNETWREYIDALADGMGKKRPRLNFPSSLSLRLAGLSEAVYGALHIKSRPLLTRHAIYLMCRDQSYPIDKAKEEFGYQPSIGFQEGIARTLDWLRSIKMT